MAHVTPKQGEKLRELGYPQKEPHERTLYGWRKSVYTPSAEELMEWLREHIKFSISVSENKWQVAIQTLRDGEFCSFNYYVEEELINALFQATSWVLEAKK